MIDENPIAKALRSAAGRRSELIGNFGQQQVSQYLAKHNVTHEVIQNRLTKVKGKWIGTKKVIGDIFAVRGGYVAIPNAAGTLSEHKIGRAVVIEIKTRDSDTELLNYSIFAKHQIERLNRWTYEGALCLVAWVRLRPSVEIRFMRWTQLAAGHSYGWEYASIEHPLACGALGIPPNDWQALNPKAAP